MRFLWPLTIRRVQLQIAGDLPLPAVAIRQKPFLAVVKFFARLGREFEIRPLDDGVHRAGLLAQTAIDALHHVDVIAGGAARAVFARLRLDGDGLGGTDGFTELAGDAAFLAIGIAAQRMLPPKARRQWPLLERIVQGGLGGEEIAHGQKQALDELPEEDLARGAVETR